jgi:CRISPR-associated protein Cmr1
MAGAEKTKNDRGREDSVPELRVPGIKGVMRFVWRAIQRSDDCNRLRKEEGELFGNAFGGKATEQSKMRMKNANVKMTTAPETPVAHRRLGEYSGGGGSNPAFTNQAIKAGATFDIVITSFVDPEAHRNYVRLFIVSCLLCGFGRRSRKGYGTVDIRGIEGPGEEIDRTWDGLVGNLNALSPNNVDYKLSGSTEIVAESAAPDRYPYIERIRIVGKKRFDSTKDVYEQIGMVVHNYARENFLGDARPRFASPLLLSTLPVEGDAYRCVVTQLFCTKGVKEEERRKFFAELDGRV